MQLRPRSAAGVLLIMALSLLSGCSSWLTHEPAATVADPVTSTAAADETTKAPEPPTLPFEIDTFYALLVAEFAGNREHYDIALGNYVQQAMKTRDPGVAARATRIARYLNARQAALTASLLWVEVDPNSEEAIFSATTELIHVGRLEEATKLSTHLLNHGNSSLFQSIAANAAKSTPEQRDQLVRIYQERLVDHPDNEDILIGLGLLHQQQNQLETALDFAQASLKKYPDSIPAAVLEARILEQQGHTRPALRRLSKLVDKYPDNTRLRLQYARMLAGTELDKAQEQFQLLVAQNPNDPDLLLSLALITLERQQTEQATEQFQQLTSVPKLRSTAHFYLGRIAQSQEHWEEALRHYVEVEPGPNFLPALLQTTDILVRIERVELAHKRLNSARLRFPSQADRFYLLEAEVLVNHGHLALAQSLLGEALTLYPQNTQLLYSRAMINEQLDQLALVENDLRAILMIEPDNASALNALGYTLADRTDRHQEALQLITKALQLKPEDPAILDSMGWVLYRLGQHKEALANLQKAMQRFPDHEVAAHLGEVLWVSGRKDDAEKVWQEGMRLNPDSHLIPEAIKRLKDVDSSD